MFIETFVQRFPPSASPPWRLSWQTFVFSRWQLLGTRIQMWCIAGSWNGKFYPCKTLWPLSLSSYNQSSVSPRHTTLLPSFHPALQMPDEKINNWNHLSTGCQSVCGKIFWAVNYLLKWQLAKHQNEVFDHLRFHDVRMCV